MWEAATHQNALYAVLPFIRAFFFAWRISCSLQGLQFFFSWNSFVVLGSSESIWCAHFFTCLLWRIAFKQLIYGVDNNQRFLHLQHDISSFVSIAIWKRRSRRRKRLCVQIQMIFKQRKRFSEKTNQVVLRDSTQCLGDVRHNVDKVFHPC